MLDIQSNVSLLYYNTFQIAVQAKYFVEISTLEQLQELFTSEIFQAEKKLILGGGANVLFTGDFEGLVIKVSLKGIEVEGVEGCEVLVRASAGEDWSTFVNYANAQGRAGLENLIAIPGNVGTAPVSNIGAYGMEVGNRIARVEGYDLQTLEWKKFLHDECEFAYRRSLFKSELRNQFLITSVVFALDQFDENYQFITNYPDIQGVLKSDSSPLSLVRMSEIIASIREKKLPDWHVIGTAGSFFANPYVSIPHFEALQKEYPTIPNYPVDDKVVKVPAAWLIEQAGLKGYSNGKAGTSPNHALIVINE
jgi:UDP-N-acetylmuramate dehydrogenase